MSVISTMVDFSTQHQLNLLLNCSVVMGSSQHAVENPYFYLISTKLVIAIRFVYFSESLNDSSDKIPTLV